jgi:ABC-2 type transport system ATP-binding protein
MPGPRGRVAARRYEGPAITARALGKRYGDLNAVRDVGFEVSPGEIFGLLGPNGAGKSTIIKILCTLTNPTSGFAQVAGYDVTRQRHAVRQSIGLVFQDTTLDLYLTAEQNLRCHADLYGVPRADQGPRMRAVLDLVGLWERRGCQVRTYSGGMRRRLEIARGLLHSPSVLFLDEPTVGLDPQTRTSIWEYAIELKRREKSTIFMTTHYMDEAENCDRIAVIDHGVIMAIDTPDALKARMGADRVRITTEDDRTACTELSRRFGINASVSTDSITFAVPDGEQFVPQLFSRLGVAIRSVRVSRPSLNDVFMSYTGRAIRDAEGGAGEHNRNIAIAIRGR